MSGERKRRALVVGGSVGGLFAANLLHRAGWDVHVFERVPEGLGQRGAGVVTHRELREILGRCGIGHGDFGVQVRGRVVLDAAGAVVASLDLPQVLTSWSSIHVRLKCAFPAERYHAGWQATEVTSAGARASVRFSNGESSEADLVVGADGVRSTLRQQMFPEVVPRYAGYVGWRGLIDEAELSVATRDALHDRFSFCLPPGEQILGYQVPGAGGPAAAGGNKYNFVWYRPAATAALQEMFTDDEGHTHAGGIPPNMISARTIAQFRGAARDLLAPPFREVVQKTPQPFFQPIQDLACRSLVRGRIVLLGDAAFVARPHCGMGITKAAEDAASLVDALANAADMDEALRGWERDRIAYGRWIVEHATQLGACLQPGALRDMPVIELARHVMRTTAVSLTELDRRSMAAAASNPTLEH